MMFTYHRNRPTKHYDENVPPLDEKLVELIAKRKTVSNNNPGFPPNEDIDMWAQKFGLYETFVHSVFTTLYNEDLHRPRVEPQGARRIIPVMRLKEIDSQVFLVTHLRQYDNASVLYLEIDSKSENQSQATHRPHVQWKLSIGPEYDCYPTSGSGNSDHFSQQFVVSPCLPDKVENIVFKFKWSSRMPNAEDGPEGEVVL